MPVMFEFPGVPRIHPALAGLAGLPINCDPAQLKQAEMPLQELHERFQILFDSILMCSKGNW
jgi:hypothetical protein